MSQVRITLNYVDLAQTINKIKTSESLEEAKNHADTLTQILDQAAERNDANFLDGGEQ